MGLMKPSRFSVTCARCNRQMLLVFDRFEQSYINRIDARAIFEYRKYMCPHCKAMVKIVER